MLIHKIVLEEDWEYPLLEAEGFLISTCKEYNINYTTCELNDIPVTEGIIGNIVQFIKNIFRKAIQFLVRLWKSIIGFVKTVISKIISFFKRIFGIKDRPKKIDISIPIIISPGVYKVMHFSSYEEMRTAYTKAMNSFSKEINKSERESINNTNKLQSQCIKTVNESMTITDESAIVYKHNTPKYMTTRGHHLLDYNFGIPKQTGWGNIDGAEDANNLTDVQKSEAIKSELDKMNFSDDDDITLPAKDEFSYINNNFIDTFDYVHVNKVNRIIGKGRTKVTGVFAHTDTAMTLEEQAKALSDLYNEFKEDCVLSILDRAEKVKTTSDRSLLGDYMKDLDLYARICEKYLGYDDMNKKLADAIFPNFDNINDPQEKINAISSYIKLRQNWNLNIVKTLRSMVLTNAKALRLGDETIREVKYNTTLHDKRYTDTEIDQYRRILSANMHKMISDDDCMIDGRKFGLGVICISDQEVEQFFDPNGVRNAYDVGSIEVLRNPLLYDTLMVNLTKYDLTVVSHGGTSDKGRWIMYQVRTPSGVRLPLVYNDDSIDVNDYLRQCIKEGFKRIHVNVCNPGHIKLDPDILMNRKVLIIMSNESVLRGW